MTRRARAPQVLSLVPLVSRGGVVSQRHPHGHLVYLALHAHSHRQRRRDLQPGLQALAQVAREFGEVRLVAPDVEQSSMGHAITHSRPLSVRRTPVDRLRGYRVNGTPADCVALGANGWEQVDVVLSGINLGPNLGNAMWHSGTLAAAKQAALLGLRGIAFSTPPAESEPDFDPPRAMGRRVLELLSRRPTLPPGQRQLPPSPAGSAGRGSRCGTTTAGGRRRDPMGREHFWFTVAPLEESRRAPTAGRWSRAGLHDAAAARPHRPGGPGARAG